MASSAGGSKFEWIGREAGTSMIITKDLSKTINQMGINAEEVVQTAEQKHDQGVSLILPSSTAA